MSGSVLLVVLLAISQSDEPASPPNLGQEPRVLRRFHDLEREMRALFQRDAHATSTQERAAAAYDMAYLFVQIQLDPRRETSPTLAEFQSRLRARLMRIKRDVERDVNHNGQSTTAAATRQLPPPVDQQTSLLATDPPGTSAHQQSSRRPPEARGGRAGAPDWGPALVELIERTIVPEFWDVNGGPGSIRYYHPLHVLVVRATDDMHHRVGTVLGNLREAGQ